MNKLLEKLKERERSKGLVPLDNKIEEAITLLVKYNYEVTFVGGRTIPIFDKLNFIPVKQVIGLDTMIPFDNEWKVKVWHSLVEDSIIDDMRDSNYFDTVILEPSGIVHESYKGREMKLNIHELAALFEYVDQQK
ncbi:hypothetical protein [Gilvibacter sp. SZ-19]|uniref:hypothetical protein n=1 Tax=Gilvibacter sp. SZ-19 TaxID=754429 RepID=UPI0012F75EA2|nr:hypothetical protein [Gilvibacter sp. SZ-19]